MNSFHTLIYRTVKASERMKQILLILVMLISICKAQSNSFFVIDTSHQKIEGIISQDSLGDYWQLSSYDSIVAYKTIKGIWEIYDTQRVMNLLFKFFKQQCDNEKYWHDKYYDLLKKLKSLYKHKLKSHQ